MGRPKLTTDIILNRFKQVHGGLYDYSKVDYKGAHIPVIIICKIHGDFKQQASHHIEGKGCQKCGLKSRLDISRLTAEEFIRRSTIIHNYKYSYLNSIYLGRLKPLIITCPIHGDFTQRPDHHMSGSGCPKCNRYKGTAINFYIRYYNKPTQVYFLHIKDNIYKIGITTRDINTRISELQKGWSDISIKVLRTKQFPTGKQAYEYEQKILNKFAKYLYTGEDIINSGNSELLSLNKRRLNEF